MKEEGREESIEKGREEGEERLSQLFIKLMAEKRFKDLEQAAKDRTFKEELYAQYGL